MAKVEMSLRDIYQNFKRADYALSDEELDFLIDNISKTLELLEQFGQRYGIAVEALQRDLQTLNGYRFARDENKS